MKARYRRKITIRVVSKSGKDESERSVNSPFSPIWQHFGFSLKFSIFFPEASPPGIESERENKRSTMSLVVSFVSNVAILTSRGLAKDGATRRFLQMYRGFPKTTKGGTIVHSPPQNISNWKKNRCRVTPI